MVNTRDILSVEQSFEDLPFFKQPHLLNCSPLDLPPFKIPFSLPEPEQHQFMRQSVLVLNLDDSADLLLSSYLLDREKQVKQNSSFCLLDIVGLRSEEI
jgi:hypothetical protein